MNLLQKISPTLISRIIRFGFGAVIVYAGIRQHSWIMIGFGALMFITGFLKPRCGEGGCSV
ncbi:MAG TPA: hypothetical protein VGD17_06285 [Chitinophagaceae bacterium]